MVGSDASGIEATAEGTIGLWAGGTAAGGCGQGVPAFGGGNADGGSGFDACRPGAGVEVGVGVGVGVVVGVGVDACMCMGIGAAAKGTGAGTGAGGGPGGPPSTAAKSMFAIK